MLKIFFSVCLTVNLLVQSMPLDSAEIQEHIVGGNDTDISQVPYQIALYVRGIFVCGGSIVSPTHVITAGHCVYRKPDDSVTIRAGSSSMKKGGVIAKTKRVYRHAGYRSSTVDYDVAVIELESPLQINNKTIKPLQLISKEPSVRTNLLVSGWGNLNEDGGFPKTLQSVIVPVVDRKICTANYKKENITITPRMMCAGREGKDACQGDSGGPLVYKDELVGIISFGVGCGRKDFAGVYTNIGDPEITKFLKDALKL